MIDLTVRHQKVLKAASSNGETHYWIRTLVFSLFLFGILLYYVFLSRGKWDLFGTNQAAANTGMILISLSFLLTSLSYFFNFADRLIVFRKHLGVLGFCWILAHIVVVMFLLPMMFPMSDWLGKRLVSFSYGAISGVIFALMTLVSNKYGMFVLGGQRWREFLRYGGYTALILGLVHQYIASSKFWVMSAVEGKYISLAYITFLLGVVTVGARLLMWMTMKVRK